MSTSFVTSPDGTRIAYDVTGTGTPIVLLHGGGHTRQRWHSTGYVERLKHHFQVITIDIRGNGESDKPTDAAGYTTDKHCQDILAVADACGLDSFALWGFSYGANIGRYLAARSNRVSRFVMVGIPFGPAAPGAFREYILGQPPTVAWLHAMLEWAPIEPADLRCPTLWLVGSNNAPAMASVQEYAAALSESKVQVQVLEGLNHGQEFTEIDRVFPTVLAFPLP